MIPETAAAERIAAAISPHLSPAWLTERCVRDLSMKIVAHRDFIRGVFDELDDNPEKLPGRDIVLQQQRTADLSDPEWVDEQIYEAQRVLDDLVALRTRIRRGHVDNYDPDAIGEREDDARVSQARADEKAATGMPRIAS